MMPDVFWMIWSGYPWMPDVVDGALVIVLLA